MNITIPKADLTWTCDCLGASDFCPFTHSIVAVFVPGEGVLLIMKNTPSPETKVVHSVSASNEAGSDVFVVPTNEVTFERAHEVAKKKFPQMEKAVPASYPVNENSLTLYYRNEQ